MAGNNDRTVNRRGILAGFGTVPVLAASAAKASVTAAPQDPAFVIIGDWGKRGSVVQRQEAQAMGAEAAAIDSRFTLAVGDNFYPAGVASVSDPHWKDSFEDVYTAPALQRPWYVALGNHDYRGNPQAQLDYTHRSRRWRMPARYYKVPAAISGMPGMDIFVLDTAPLVSAPHEIGQQVIRGHFWREDRKAQLRWFEHELKTSTAPWKVVVGHHPVYSGAHGNDPDLIADIQPLLERYGVQAYINGHDHDLQHIVVGPVSYICSGAGAEAGSVRPIEGTRFCLSRAGFTTMSLNAETLSFAFRDLNGERVYAADIARRPAHGRGIQNA